MQKTGNEERQNSSDSPKIISAIRSRRMRWTRHVAHVQTMKTNAKFVKETAWEETARGSQMSMEEQY
jgi:hypothetical protein